MGIERNLATQSIYPTTVTPQVVELNALEDELNKRGDRLSSAQERSAYRAFIRNEVKKIKELIEGLSNMGVSGPKLNLAIEEFSRDLKDIANNYLSNCNSYQAMSAQIAVKLESTAKKIEDKKWELTDLFPSSETVGTFAGAAAGSLIKDTVSAKLDKIATARMTTKMTKAFHNETNATRIAADLQQLEYESNLYMTHAKERAIKAATKDGVCDMAKVRKLLEQDLQGAQALSEKAEEARRAKVAASAARAKLQEKSIAAAGKLSVRKLTTQSVLIGGAALAGKVIGKLAGCGVDLLLQSDDLAGPEHDELPKEPNDFSTDKI